MKRSLHALVLAAAASFAGMVFWSTSAPAQAPAPLKGGIKGGKGVKGAPGGGGRAMGMEDGLTYFQTKCMACHSEHTTKYPTVRQIRTMTPEQIYPVLQKPSRMEHDAGLTDDQKRRLAEFMGGYRQLGSAEAGNPKNFGNACPANPQMTDPAKSASWSGWGNDVANTRFQTAEAAGINKDTVTKLKLKWTWGFPLGISAYNTPAIASGRVFTGSDIGWIYSLDAKTGCYYWGYEVGNTTRGALSVGPVTGQGSAKYAVYFGDAKANIYALDAQTGKLLWRRKVEESWTARITAAPKLYKGKLYVPVSMSEEWQGGNPDYECCSFRGSVAALNANNGELVWQRYMMDEPKPTKKNPNGVQLYGPAGASVWNSPTIDTKNNAIYFGTGDAETAPAAELSDSIVALDLTSGKVLWHYQATANDAFMGGCGRGQDKSLACPEPNGPDLDIGNSPMLRTLPNGKRVLVAGMKTGEVFGIDPDDKGKLLWKVQAVPDGRGNIIWGGAADSTTAYYGQGGPGGLTAIDIATGKIKWYNALTPGGGGRNGGNNAPATLIPGVVFVGGGDGVIHALNTDDGKEIWTFATSKPFDTVNKVADAHGGAIGSVGPVFAGGMMFVGSGNGVSGGNGFGNVLLAFGVE